MSEQITPNPSVPSQVVQEVKFPQFVNNLGIIPTSYKDSMSYYETLAWLCKYLEETVIPTLNQNGNAVKELQELYVELNNYVAHYFDNLDVQEEINNKLDDMAEAGTLEEIISAYLNSTAVFGYDTVASMKEAINLIDGSYARTMGYTSVNDLKGGLYRIREITNSDIVDEINIISLNNSDTLIAELIQNNELYIYNTLNDLKNSKLLSVGTYAKILGYYSLNDGITNNYIITDEIPSSFYETLSEGLYAELIIDNQISPQNLGAKGDGINDDTSYVQNAYNISKSKNIKLFLKGTYLINDSILIDGKFDIEGINDCRIIQNNPSKDILVFDRPYQALIHNSSLKNLQLEYKTFGNQNTSAIRITQTSETKDHYGMYNNIFENIYINKPYYGIYTDVNEPLWNNKFKNIYVYGTIYQAISYNTGFGNEFDVAILGPSANNEITRTIAFLCQGGGIVKLDVEDWTGVVLKDDSAFNPLHILSIHMERCTLSTNYGSFISFGNTEIQIDEIKMYNCTLDVANFGNLIRAYGPANATTNSVVVTHANCTGLTKTTESAKLSVIEPAGTVSNLHSVVCQNGFDYPFYPYPSADAKTNCKYKYDDYFTT